MIVISSSVVLSDGGDIDENNPLVGYKNLVSPATLTADGEDASFPVENAASQLTSLRWVGADNSEQYLTIDTDGLGDVDYLAVARHNFGTEQIEVVPEGKVTSMDSYSELTDSLLPGDDSPILFRFDKSGYFSVRLKMSSGSGAPFVGIIFVGELLVVQRRIYVGHTPIHMGLVTRTQNNRSQSGEFLGQVITNEIFDTEAVFRNLTPSWYRANFQPFVEAAKTSPFFFAWRPGDYPLEVGLVTFADDPTPENSRANGMMDVTLQMTGLAL